MSRHNSLTAGAPAAARERGQILVIFVISIFAIIGMVGIVLDGGSTFAQRRDEQNVADIAAMAGAAAYLNTTGDNATKTAAADAAARSLASTNGYTDTVDGVVVGVDVASTSLAATVQVDVTKPHRNNFAAVVGFVSWPVTVTATALSSASANGANGAMPLLFNADAFPGAICDEDAGGCIPEVYQLPGSGNEDVPQDATQFNWTIFCTASGNPCNGDSDGVRELIDGNGESTTIYLDDDIGPLNAGSHTTLFNALENYVGGVFPVPIVCTLNNDPDCPADGAMVGWAYFKLLSVEGSSEKVIRGYFVSPVNADQLVVNGDSTGATLNTGTYKLTLID